MCSLLKSTESRPNWKKRQEPRVRDGAQPSFSHRWTLTDMLLTPLPASLWTPHPEDCLHLRNESQKYPASFRQSCQESTRKNPEMSFHHPLLEDFLNPSPRFTGLACTSERVNIYHLPPEQQPMNSFLKWHPRNLFHITRNFSFKPSYLLWF